MLDYTLEEVIDFINSEIEDAYTEASKEDLFKDLLKSKIKQRIKEGKVVRLDDIDDLGSDIKVSKSSDFDDDIKKAMDKYNKTHDTTYLDIANDLRKEKELSGKRVNSLTHKVESINDYTEAGKEEADELAERGKNWREWSGKSKIKEFGDKALPKGDPETVRRKNIRKETSVGTHVPQHKKEPGNPFYDHPLDISYNSKPGPYHKKYEEISKKEREIQDKISKKAKDFKDKQGKEYEVYYGDKDDKDSAKYFIKKTRSEGKHPITLDAYNKHAYPFDNPEHKASRKREYAALDKARVSGKLAYRADKGFKNKDVEAKWKKFVDKYEETVYDILEAYEYDVISYEDANDYLDMLALFED